MKIKITGCSSTNYWYGGSIGEIFEVTKGTDRDYYIKRNNSKCTCCVAKKDCEVIKEKEVKKIKIVKCKYNQYWYINLIKSVFEVASETPDNYLVSVGTQTNYGIRKEDAVVIYPIPEKVYKPFSNADGASIIGKPIKNIRAPKYLAIIQWVGDKYIYTSNNRAEQIDYKELFDSWTFLDGSPCGILK